MQISNLQLAMCKNVFNDEILLLIFAT